MSDTVHSDGFAVRDMAPTDEAMVVSQWLMSHSASREGYAEGASAPLDADGRPTMDKARREAFWNHHRPIVEHLVRTATVRVVCDEVCTDLCYAWACYDNERDIVHHAVVKRSVDRTLGPEVAASMLRALLGSRLERSCGYTYFSRDLLTHDLMPRTRETQWYPHVGAIVSASWRARV